MSTLFILCQPNLLGGGKGMLKGSMTVSFKNYNLLRLLT